MWRQKQPLPLATRTFAIAIASEKTKGSSHLATQQESYQPITPILLLLLLLLLLPQKEI